jgi:hypothetical protein
VIEEKGTWEEVAPGEFATTCVGGAECVFVVDWERVAGAWGVDARGSSC